VLIQQLEYLVALAQQRHFGRAAASCNVSQPTLSVAIRRLERELDVSIVQRGHRFDGFTEEGQRVVAWAHRILAERDELFADVERMRGQVTTVARIGAIPTSVPASALLTTKFLERHPAATIRVEALPSREIARRLADFEIDGGLTYLDDETPPGCHRMELYREQYVLIAPAALPLMREPEIPWARAAELPLCALNPAMRNRRIIERNVAAEGARLRPVVETDTVGALFAHLTTLQFATIASTAWLSAFGIAEGLAIRRMAARGPGPAVGLIVLDRKPESIAARALVKAAGEADVAGALDAVLDDLLVAGDRPSDE
jgi:DNA-binding transcriptional LysR family regulator